MINLKTSFRKPVSNKILLNYLLLGLVLLIIIIGLSFKVFYHKPTSVPNIPQPEKPPANIISNDKGSESVDQLSSSATSAGPLTVVYQIPVNQPVVFITIDDGWYPDQDVLKLMNQYHLPITTYLVEQAAEEHPTFWHEFVTAGGHIEDHTFDHPFLTHLTLDNQISQISKPIEYFRQYGPPPDQLRPPYGDFNSQVGQAAKDSGIKHIVMWDAEMKNSTFTTRSGLGLKSGDIILLHWEPGLSQELLKLLTIIQRQNLGIADLGQALDGKPLTISWLKSPIVVTKPVTKTSKTTIASGKAPGTAKPSK